MTLPNPSLLVSRLCVTEACSETSKITINVLSTSAVTMHDQEDGLSLCIDFDILFIYFALSVACPMCCSIRAGFMATSIGPQESKGLCFFICP